MLWLDVLSRVVHVSTAIVLLGGSLFSLLVLQPALAKTTGAEADSIKQLVGGRWKRFVHIGIALFLMSGFYNYIQAMPKHEGDRAYHAIIGTKILLALAVFFIASVLVGRSPAFESWRKNGGWPLKLICIFGLVIVALSGFVKVNSSVVP